MVSDNPLESDASDRQLYCKAIELLARREHSRLELMRKLAPHRALEDEEPIRSQQRLASVLDGLASNGYQSDERFTEAYVRSRLRKGFGLQRIAMELAQRGIADDIAAPVLSDYDNNHGGELNAADVIFSTWQKKFGLPPQDFKERVKQQRFLQYRGFSDEEIAQLFDRIERELHL